MQMPKVVIAFGGSFAPESGPSMQLSDEVRSTGRDVVSHFVSDA